MNVLGVHIEDPVTIPRTPCFLYKLEVATMCSARDVAVALKAMLDETSETCDAVLGQVMRQEGTNKGMRTIPKNNHP